MSMTRGLTGTRVQIVLLSTFVLINCCLFFLSQDQVVEGVAHKATYWNASDGQRYWGVAIDLAQLGTFTMAPSDHEPLSRAGPVPALLFSVPIYMTGWEDAAFWIVVIQCGFLYWMGFLARSLARNVGAHATVAQGLVIFNPNLVGLAHHAQSDLLFAFFLGAVLAISSSILRNQGRSTRGQMVCLIVCLGLLPLTRPLGLYFLIVYPFLMILTLMFQKELRNWRRVRRLTSKLLICALVASLLTVPWAMRNHVVFSDFGLTQSEAIMMRDQYKFLLRFNGVGTADRYQEIENRANEYFKKKSLPDNCIQELKKPGCKPLLTRAYFEAILATPTQELAWGLAASWTVILFSASSSRVVDYLGISGLEAHEIVLDKFEGLSSLKEFVREISSEYVAYFAIFSMFLAFVLVTRIFGIVGFFTMLRERESRQQLFFMLAVVGLFLAMYLFVGVGRYRAPLEIILMVFAAAGIQTVFGRWSGRPHASRELPKKDQAVR